MREVSASVLGTDPFFPAFIANVESELAPRGLAQVSQPGLPAVTLNRPPEPCPQPAVCVDVAAGVTAPGTPPVPSSTSSNTAGPTT
jgi:hypothetical protein